MRRLCYAAQQLVIGLFTLASCITNALVFGGSARQSLSARCYVEAAAAPKSVWARRVRVINTIIFWEADHCFESWLDEIARARRALELNSSIQRKPEHANKK